METPEKTDRADRESVVIKLHSIQRTSSADVFEEILPSDDKDMFPVKISFVCDGKLSYDGGNTVLSYREPEDDGGCFVKITISGKNDKITVSRHGEADCTFSLICGTTCVSVYETPLGEMELAVRPTEIKYDVTQSEAMLVLDYYSQIRGCDAQHIVMRIDAKRREK